MQKTKHGGTHGHSLMIILHVLFLRVEGEYLDTDVEVLSLVLHVAIRPSTTMSTSVCERARQFECTFSTSMLKNLKVRFFPFYSIHTEFQY